MSSGESHAVRNGVIATVVGGVALAILGELWPPVKASVAWFWEKTQAFAGLFGESYSVPGWVLTVLGVFALVTIVRSIVGLRTRPTAPHSNYVEDILFRTKWRWSWSGGDISNLWCFCPVCDSELVYDDSTAHGIYSREVPRTVFICEHCNRNTMGSIEGGDKEYALGAVRREIRRRIRTGQYANNHNVG
jgi:hypothetical protein